MPLITDEMINGIIKVMNQPHPSFWKSIDDNIGEIWEFAEDRKNQIRQLVQKFNEAKTVLGLIVKLSSFLKTQKDKNTVEARVCKALLLAFSIQHAKREGLKIEKTKPVEKLQPQLEVEKTVRLASPDDPIEVITIATNIFRELLLKDGIEKGRLLAEKMLDHSVQVVEEVKEVISILPKPPMVAKVDDDVASVSSSMTPPGRSFTPTLKCATEGIEVQDHYSAERKRAEEARHSRR